MSRILKPIVVLWLCLAAVNVFAIKAQTTPGVGNSVDPYLQLAKFHFHKGNLDKALLTIEQAAFLWPVADTSDRYIFSAEILVEQKRFADAQKAFNKVLTNRKALTLMGKVSFPLAQLHFAKNNCVKALRLLKVSKKGDAYKMLQSFYMRSYCLASNPQLQMTSLESIQFDIDAYVEEHRRDKQLATQSMWLAYTYYNLAIAAQSLKLESEAFALFDSAMKFSKGSPESFDFIERIKMTQAFAKYFSYQYDEALVLFSSLSLDSLWLDQSLLGFGWSAFHNFERGLALEAWYQLVNIPNRSMSVYEAMMTIPFALEKGKSFARALKAYDLAIDNYSVALTEIDDLQENLSLSSIRQHALEYVNNLQSGKPIEPLHPLLSGFYTQDGFRHAVKQVGEIAYEKEKLKRYEAELDILTASLDWRPASPNSLVLKERSKKLIVRLESYKQGIYNLRASMLKQVMSSSDVSKDIRVRYNRYNAVKVMAEKYGVKSERMQRLQGVILWQLYEAGEYPSDSLLVISRMIANQRILQARLNGLPGSLNAMAQFDRPGSKQMAMLKARIQLLESKLNRASVKAEQYVLDMTITALTDYEIKIINFQKQARIASTRLKEEFYQIGGHK